MRTALLTMAVALAGAASAAEPPAAARSGYDSAFADYQPYREPAVKLAGRDKVVAPAKAADPHAGHAMHHPAPAAKPDPHAGHARQQPEPKPAPPAGHEGHEHHGHHQE